MTSHFSRWLAIVLRIAVVVLLVSLIVWIVGAYRGSHKAVEIPTENRTRFAQVAILIDGTHSVQGDFPTMKRVVQAKIIPYLGFGDTVRCYEVQPDFESDKNLVFGDLEEQKLLTEYKDLRPRYPRLEELRKNWSQKVADLKPREDKGSDICNPLLNLADFLQPGGASTEKWLFVLSDFRNESPASACNPEKPFPKDAHIVWIYPFRSQGPRWQEVADFWHPLLGDREPERFSPDALINRTLLRPNPMAGLEDYRPKTWWECARPLLPPLLRVDGVLMALGAIVAALAVWLPKAS
jgi:hypothetical protein